MESTWRNKYGVSSNQNIYEKEEIGTTNAYHTIVMDAIGLKFNLDDLDEPLNPEAQKFYDILSVADKKLCPRCTQYSKLSFVAQIMSMKSKHHMSERNFNEMLKHMKEIVSEDNAMTNNFYSTKKLLRGMGLPVEKID